MPATESTMLTLGTPAPDFHLPDVRHGRTISLGDFEGKKALLVIFLCRHCPYVVHVREELTRLDRDYAGQGVGIVAISANDAESFPADAPESLAQMAEDAGWNFPVCYDESQETAHAYSAACTPDFFLFDGGRKLAYRGQLDDTRPGRAEPNGRDLRAALDAILAGQPVDPDQKPGIGCSIKWKKNSTPDSPRQ